MKGLTLLGIGITLDLRPMNNQVLKQLLYSIILLLKNSFYWLKYFYNQ